jgi:tetraacyldisaccharide 4'-kinase
MLTIPLSFIYGAGAALYHRVWDLRSPSRVDVPVISVGNLTVGGNGKTPFVIALAKLLMESEPALRERNAIAVLSRGYGRKERRQVVVEPDSDWKEAGDEPILIKRACPSALILSGVERARSARRAVEEFGSKLILLDDGFQHRAIARDLDIVLLDAAKPLGNGWRLPAGPMRESVAALGRANAILSVGTGDVAEKLGRQMGILTVQALPRVELSQVLPSPMGKRCFLLTGIARPERVVAMLQQKGIEPVGHRAYGDHAEFTESALSEVEKAARQSKAELILTTEKDQVRLRSWKGEIPLASVPYTIEIMNKEILMKAVEKVIGGRM